MQERQGRHLDSAASLIAEAVGAGTAHSKLWGWQDSATTLLPGPQSSYKLGLGEETTALLLQPQSGRLGAKLG